MKYFTLVYLNAKKMYVPGDDPNLAVDLAIGNSTSGVRCVRAFLNYHSIGYYNKQQILNGLVATGRQAAMQRLLEDRVNAHTASVGE